MDIEQLNKTQIVLLVLLVSFVTSIATGIVTVTLLDQAPPAVTQTINRVVERTIERVVPGKSPDPKIVTKEVTMVVNEADLVAEAIEKSTPVLVRIFEADIFVGLGIMATRDGIIATDRTILNIENTYRVMVDSGDVYEAAVILSRTESPVALLKIVPAETETLNFVQATFSNLNNVKLGQTVISLSGKTHTSVSVGIISGLPIAEINKISTSSVLVKDEKNKIISPDSTTQLGSLVSRFIGDSEENKTIAENKNSSFSLIETNIDGVQILLGSTLIDVFGEMIGMKVSTYGNDSAYIPVNIIVTELTILAETKEATIVDTP